MHEHTVIPTCWDTFTRVIIHGARRCYLLIKAIPPTALIVVGTDPIGVVSDDLDSGHLARAIVLIRRGTFWTGYGS